MTIRRGEREYRRTSQWFSPDNGVNTMGPIEKRFPSEVGKLKYKELPIPAAVEDDK